MLDSVPELRTRLGEVLRALLKLEGRMHMRGHSRLSCNLRLGPAVQNNWSIALRLDMVFGYVLGDYRLGCIQLLSKDHCSRRDSRNSLSHHWSRHSQVLIE